MIDSHLFALLSIILIIIGILGTFLPVLPGLVFCFIGTLVYKYGVNPDFSIWYIVIFGILTIASVIINYVVPMKTTQKYGGSNYGKIGGLLGTFAGMFFIPIPLGFLIGMFLGVFLGELLHDRNDKQKAFNATKGALIGFIYSTGFNLLVGLAMFLVVIINYISL